MMKGGLHKLQMKNCTIISKLNNYEKSDYKEGNKTRYK